MATMMTTPECELRGNTLEIAEPADVRAGSPLPLGTHDSEGGANFAVSSRNASRVRLELFDRPEDAKPARMIDLDSTRNRTGDIWHVWVEGIRSGLPVRPSRRHSSSNSLALTEPPRQFDGKDRSVLGVATKPVRAFAERFASDISRDSDQTPGF
jgi:hypothetical protein